VVGHRAFGVEGQRVEGAVHREALAHRGKHVIEVVVGGQVGHGGQPALVAPQRGLVHANGEHVELSTLGGDVGGQPLAQHVLFEYHPVEVDLGIVLLEGLGEALHADHVRVVDGGDGEGFGGKGKVCQGNAGGTEQ